jgi:hypothetical protein
MLSVMVLAKGYSGIVKLDNNLIKKYKEQLLQIDEEQYYYLRYAMKHCIDINAWWTCAAIAWEESHFNAYGYNETTGDFGLMGINLKWYIIDHKLNLSYWQKKKLATKLIRDDKFNLSVAKSNLKYWMKRWKNDWIKVWGSYNGGTVPNYYYSKRILNRIWVLRKYLPELEKKYNWMLTSD